MSDSTRSGTQESKRPEHGIAVVERRTGVSQAVLRAWERRYSVVAPSRSAGGQRLYSDDDIERIRLVRTVAAGGRRVGTLASLTDEQLRELARSDVQDDVSIRHRAPAGSSADAASAERLRECLVAVQRMDSSMIYVLLMRAAASLSAREFIDGVAAPLLRVVGDSWAGGALRPVNEHSASVALRRVLAWRLAAIPAPAEAPLAVFATPPGQRHEFGAMFAAIVAASEQWRVQYFGPDLPIDDIAYAAKLADADVVALSIINPDSAELLLRDVRQLRADLVPSVRLVVGGHAAVLQSSALSDSRAEVISDLAEWERWLSETRRALVSPRS